MKKSLSILLIGSLLTGCDACYSSMHYTNGTACLDRGDYEQAVVELTCAVELDPALARNYSNLAAACIGVGDYESAWCYLRQAVLCRYQDPVANRNFRKVCSNRLAQKNLDCCGTSYEEISECLGTPDDIEYSDNGSVAFCSYGTYVMEFSDNKLVTGYFRK